MVKTGKLPEGLLVRDGKIYRHWHDKQGNHEEVVTNGTFKVIAIMKYANAPNDHFLIVQFTSNDGATCENVQIPISELKGSGKKLLNYTPDWFILLVSPPTKQLTFLQNALNLQRNGIDEVVTVSPVGPGYYIADDGSLFFCLGNEVVNKPAGMALKLTSPFHLRYTGRSLRSGATLSSDKADIFRMMSACRDMPFLIDDLNDSGIATASIKKKERLSEIIQQLSGSGTLSIRGEKFDVGLATPIITAETLFDQS